MSDTKSKPRWLSFPGIQAVARGAQEREDADRVPRRAVRGGRYRFISAIAWVLCVGVVFCSSASRAHADGCSGSAPQNSVPPRLSGSAVVGGSLVVDQGTWVDCGSPVTGYSYAWRRDGEAIEGATSASYTTTEDDAGAHLSARVTATNAVGSTSADSDSVQVAVDGDEYGELESDQSQDVADETQWSPAAPQPVTPVGQAPPGTYTTERWSASETGSDDGLDVVHPAGSSTVALTGVVLDETTGEPISGAQVSLTWYDWCQNCPGVCLDDPTGCPPRTPMPTTTTTDSRGAFSFTGMPIKTYDLSVLKSGYGSFTEANQSYDGGIGYQQTVTLGEGTQYYDLNDQPEGHKPGPHWVDEEPGMAYSRIRTPPSIRVAHVDRYTRNAPDGSYFQCDPTGPPPSNPRVVNWAFDYYVLRVIKEEAENLSYNVVGFRAFAALVQNYAWFRKTRLGEYDVDDSTRFQCFRPSRRVDPRWREWLNEVLKHRVVGPLGLKETHYQAGAVDCDDPRFPPGVNDANQHGIKALSTPGSGCYKPDWKDIATHYYTSGTRVVRSGGPMPPRTSFAKTSNSITFNFVSSESGKPYAWSYYLSKLVDGQWKRIATVGWEHRLRAVRSSKTIPASGCARYSVRAHNPRGTSQRARFNGGEQICV